MGCAGGRGQRGLTIHYTRNFTKTLPNKRIFFYLDALRIFEDKVVSNICGAKKHEATTAWKDVSLASAR
jgi:hypothetical protein